MNFLLARLLSLKRRPVRSDGIASARPTTYIARIAPDPGRNPRPGEPHIDFGARRGLLRNDVEIAGPLLQQEGQKDADHDVAAPPDELARPWYGLLAAAVGARKGLPFAIGWGLIGLNEPRVNCATSSVQEVGAWMT